MLCASGPGHVVVKLNDNVALHTIGSRDRLFERCILVVANRCNSLRNLELDGLRACKVALAGDGNLCCPGFGVVGVGNLVVRVLDELVLTEGQGDIGSDGLAGVELIGNLVRLGIGDICCLNRKISKRGAFIVASKGDGCLCGSHISVVGPLDCVISTLIQSNSVVVGISE